MSNLLGIRGLLARLVVVLVLVASSMTVLGGTRPVAAQQPTGSLSIQKVADATTVEPGQTFEYTIQVQCSTAAAAGCVNAELTDTLPPYILLDDGVDDISVTGAASTPTITEGPPLTVGFNDDLGGGDTGLVAGQIVTITIPVVVDPTIPPTEDGIPIDNTAMIDADNAEQRNSTATVTPEVPVTISTDTTKSYDPDSQVAGSTDPITLSLTASNTSNVPVDTLVIQDPPEDPPTNDNTNPFFYLALTSVPTPALPPNADEVTVEVYDPGVPGWVDASTATLATATGVRYTFTDTTGDGIEPGATVDVDLTLAQRGTAVNPPYVIDNTVESTVDRGGETADAQAGDDFNIRQSTLDVDATKTIEPSSMNAGGSATVTLGGINGPDPLTSMTITEPADNANNPFVGPNPVVFAGFGDVQWPADADAAEITYECSGTDVPPISTTTVDTLPDPPAGCDPVTGFSVTFTGDILPDSQAVIPFTIDTPEDQPTDTFLRPNLVRVDGTDGTSADSAFASDVLVTIVDRIDVETDKTVTPPEIPGRPGQIVIVQLEGELLPFPESSVDASTIIVQDPATVPSPWFDAFAPQSVTATPVPACSTLTVQYTTSTAEPAVWVDVPGMLGIVGPTIVNEPLPAPIPDTATGIRFVYAAAVPGAGCEGGFPPGTSVAPNLSFSVRPGGDADQPDTDTTFTDCADTSADPVAGSNADPVESPEACDDVVVTPIDPGAGDPIDKAWDRNLLNARSQDRSGITISWSTQGYSGLAGVRITDVPDPGGTALPDSVFDAFDLVRIDEITPDMDPHLTYDQVVATELFQVVSAGDDPSTGTWVQPDNDPCLDPTACDGTYPGYVVRVPERATTLGFRLTYVESPTRADRLDAGAPPVGTGVAPSAGNDREIRPVFELRDVLRSDPTVPVIAENLYNTGTPGLIRNDVMIEAVFDFGDDPFEFFDSDTIAIVDVPVTVNSTKTWTGGPLGIPQPGVPQSEYPRSLVTLTGTNTTPAKIDTLVIADDTAGDTFEWFNLSEFGEITPAADVGADDVTVTLTGLTPEDYTRDEALALTEAELVDVTQVTVTYTGRININDPPGAGRATVTFGARLREFARSDGTTRPTAADSPVANQATVSGADLVDIPPGNIPNPDNWTADSTSDADMELIEQGILVNATKTIVPESQQEPDDSPVTVTIGGQPTGGGDPPQPPPSRAVEMVLIDDDPLLFNQYDFVSLDDIAFTAPIDQVRVDALTGGNWALDGGGDPTVTGATWQIGTETTGPGLSLPAGVLPGDVQGLRFTFTRVDGANWENPTTRPNQTVSFQIERRDNLNIGAGGEIDTIPVPVDLPDYNEPAPGETVAGTATNTSTAQAISSDVDANGDPITSDIAEATDTIVYEHADNSVQVRKSTDPSSDLPPGQPFTYVLTTTNNGDVDITNPVITDYFPFDGGGPIIELADPPNYTYEITGGTGMPTAPVLVTVTDNSTDAINPTLAFTFPDGSTLPVGATYTITFDAVPRAGYEAGVPFANEFGVVGDRPWDACDGDPDDTIDPDTGECLAAADNQLQDAGAMSVTKLVQAEGSDQLGLTTDPVVAGADPADCVADADGFYARPCIPIAQPGGDITFRLRFVNSGNRDIDRILGIDSLPAPGDTLATVPAIGRGSQWRPTLTGQRPELADPAFGTLNVWFTTGASACDAIAPTVADDSAAPPNLLCPALGWVAWPDGTDLPVDPDTVTGIQVEILPAAGTVFNPAGTVDVDVQMVAPAFDPAADYTAPQMQPDTITYNTVGTTGRILDGQGTPQSYTLPSEPPRVGAALANGPLRLLKVVRGDASRWAPDSFPVTLSCVSAGVAVPIPPSVANRTLVPGQPQVINNLPWGAECTLTEVGNQGQTTVTSTTATVGRDDQTIRTARLVNVYADAPLTITKIVDSDAVDQDGSAVTYGPFTVTVRCTFRGGQVYADGYGPGTPMDFVLDDGDTVTLTGLPVGANCVIRETDDKGAAATTITVVAPAGGSSGERTRATVRLPDGNVTATITNVFTVGSVEIEKVVDGNLDAPGSAGPFTVEMVCTLDDESGSRVVYEGSFVLGGTRPLTSTIDDLATGARCTFSETDTSGADEVTIAPAGGVVVGDGTTATLTVTNTYDSGSVSITKVVRGDSTAPGATGPFVINIRCTMPGTMGVPTVVFDANVTLGGGNPLTATIDDLPTGAHCDFDEIEAQGARSVIDPANGVDVGDGTIVSVRVINTFDVRPNPPTPPTPPVPPPTPLPPTGGSTAQTVALASLVLALGAFASIVGRRRRSTARS